MKPVIISGSERIGFQVSSSFEVVAHGLPTKAEAEHWREIYIAHQKELAEMVKKSFYRKRSDPTVRMVVISEYNNSALPPRYFCREYSLDGSIEYHLYTLETINKKFETLTF